jgi:hypothetical protein
MHIIHFESNNGLGIYIHDHNILTNTFGLPIITCFMYDEPDLIQCYNKLNPVKYHNNDILIINSCPQSHQI